MYIVRYVGMYSNVYMVAEERQTDNHLVQCVKNYVVEKVVTPSTPNNGQGFVLFDRVFLVGLH